MREVDGARAALCGESIDGRVEAFDETGCSVFRNHETNFLGRRRRCRRRACDATGCLSGRDFGCERIRIPCFAARTGPGFQVSSAGPRGRCGGCVFRFAPCRFFPIAIRSSRRSRFCQSTLFISAPLPDQGSPRLRPTPPPRSTHRHRLRRPGCCISSWLRRGRAAAGLPASASGSSPGCARAPLPALRAGPPLPW
jgi:hypothetical protein